METIDSGVGAARKVSLNWSQETRKFSFCLKLFCPEFWKLLVKRKKLNHKNIHTYIMDKGTEHKRINKETRKVGFAKSSLYVRDGSGQQNPDPPLAKKQKGEKRVLNFIRR